VGKEEDIIRFTEFIRELVKVASEGWEKGEADGSYEIRNDGGKVKGKLKASKTERF